MGGVGSDYIVYCVMDWQFRPDTIMTPSSIELETNFRIDLAIHPLSMYPYVS